MLPKPLHFAALYGCLALLPSADETPDRKSQVHGISEGGSDTYTLEF